LALVDNLDDDDEWDERLEFQPPNANALHKNTATMGSYHRPLEDFKIKESLQLSDLEIHTTEQRDRCQQYLTVTFIRTNTYCNQDDG
jgi:hypothetical protein